MLHLAILAAELQNFVKEKFVTKIFFLDIVEWSSKNLWKMIPADVKANKNNKN